MVSVPISIVFLVMVPRVSEAATYSYFAVSYDGRASFKTWDSTQGDTGWRLIASSLNSDHGGTNGVWYYNSNTTAGATDITWSACTTNAQDSCIAQAMGVTPNQMDKTAFEAITDAQWEDMGGWHYLTRGDNINVAIGLKTTSTSETPIVNDIAFTYTAGSATPIYRSVQAGKTTALATGTGNNLTISGTTATFANDLVDWIGVGDAIQYNNGSVDAIAFIHRRNGPKSYIVASAAGGTPTATSATENWSIFRAYTSLSNAEAGTTNTGISVSFDTWSGGRDLTSTGESWNIALYAGEFECGTDTVTYAAVTYSTVEIGTQCWLGENLNVGTRVNGSVTMTDNSTLEKHCYADTELNCTNEGGLYQWDEAMDYVETEGTQGICPEGWHIPTDAEWSTLVNYLGTGAGTALKVGGSSGFEGILAGYRHTAGSFFSRGSNALFWSSSVSGSDAFYRYLSSGSTTVYRSTSDQASGFSIRCLKD